MKGLFQENKQIIKPGNNGLYALVQSMKELKQAIGNINIPENVEVKNLDYIKLYLRQELSLLSKQINNIIKSIRFPKSIEVSNLEKYPDIIKVPELKQVIEAIHDLRAIMSQIEYNPTINIETPKIEPPEVKIPPIKVPSINVPKPEVTVNPEVEIDLSELLSALKPLSYLSDKAGKPLSVRLSDGARFIKALKDVVDKQEKQITAFATSRGIDEDEFQNKFRQNTRASSLVTGRKAVAAAGTAVKIVTASTPCFRVDLNADMGNENAVVVGDSGVVAAEDSQEGTILIPGNPPHIMLIDNLSKVYVDSIVNGDAVVYTAYKY